MGWTPGAARTHDGANYIAVEFDGYPLAVEAPPNEASQIRFTCEFSKPFRIWAVDIFHGHDRGDVFEMDTTIFTLGDSFVTRRVEENEQPAHREASRCYVLPQPLSTAGLVVYSTCRVTGASRIDEQSHPSYQAAHDRGNPRWRANFDLGLTLVGEWRP